MEGSVMEDFRYMKYETKSKDEQKKIEDAMVEKMEKWKYDPNELKWKYPYALLKFVPHHWSNALKI